MTFTDSELLAEVESLLGYASAHAGVAHVAHVQMVQTCLRTRLLSPQGPTPMQPTEVQEAWGDAMITINPEDIWVTFPS